MARRCRPAARRKSANACSEMKRGADDALPLLMVAGHHRPPLTNMNRARIPSRPAVSTCLLAAVLAPLCGAARADPSLEEVIVTAQRRAQPVDDVPISIT